MAQSRSSAYSKQRLPFKRKPKCKFVQKDPGSVKSPQRNVLIPTNSTTYGLNSSEAEDSATESAPDPPNASSAPTTSSNPAPTPPDSPKKQPKGLFKTKWHGIKKSQKKIRWFKCPSCDVYKDSTAKLNEHFDCHHEQLQCKQCFMNFSTPSGLDRHWYVHKPPHFHCNICGKPFYFVGEMNQHKVSHCTIRTQVCNYRNFWIEWNY